MILTKGGFRMLLKSNRTFSELIGFYSSTAVKDLPSDGLPLVGSLFSFIKSGSSPKLHLYIDEKHKKLGPVFREVMPSRNIVFLSDPDKIREVFSLEGKCPAHFLPESWLLYNNIYSRKRGLLFMEKEEWQHYRKIMNQFLLKDNLSEHLIPIYKEIVDSLIKKWKGQADSGRHIDSLESDMYKHSIAFIIATAMGSSYHETKHLFEYDLERLAKHYQNIFDTSSKLMVVPVNLALNLNLTSWSYFVSAMDIALQETEQVMEKIKNHMSDDGLFRKLEGAGVSSKMATTLITDLMMAAGDTTAYTIQWALYLLGKSINAQDRVRNDDELVKGVIKETLRLYPAAPFLTRQIQQQLEVSSYCIPAKEMVVMSMYTCSRSEANFPKANEFHPERWTRNSEGQVGGVNNKFASLPFAMGARSCVGKKLAETLMTMTLTSILSQYKITTINEVEMILRLTPAPSDKIKILIQSR